MYNQSYDLLKKALPRRFACSPSFLLDFLRIAMSVAETCEDCQDAKSKAYSKEGMAKNRPVVVDGGCIEDFDALDHCLKTKGGSICE
jgi:hypothetical protein